MERQVEELNREVQREVLARRHAEKAADSAGCAKNIFLATMGHEIRTPLNGILGMTELLLDTQLKPGQREDLNMIRLSADSLLGVINDVLDFSEIEAGNLEFEKSDFGLRETLGAAVKPLSLRAHEKGLELTCNIRPSVPDAVIGDPERLQQVLVNLVANAIKFTERGTLVVDVDLQSQSGQNAWLRFSVSDPGIGVSPEIQRAIFEPFTQADGSTKRKFGGSGLGLSISAKLVQGMGGKIWVESGPARQGSIFYFTACFGLPAAPLAESLPVKSVSNGNGLAKPAEGRGSSPEQSPISFSMVSRTELCLKILLAEDNLVNQKLATRLLEKRGHRVTTAKDGWEALAALSLAAHNNETFDLVLMDIDMPEMDGFETTSAIRKQEENTGAHLLIMAMTAHAMKGDEDRCLAAGMDAYVSKPIQPSELFEKISRLFRDADSDSANTEFASRGCSRINPQKVES